MKRRYHHGDLERALMNTALEIIAEVGLDGLTLRNVAARVGVSRSALYRHFDDKAALVARVASDGFRLLHETLVRVRTNAPSDSTPWETLEVMAAAHVHFAQSNPSHYVTMFGGVVREWGKYPALMASAAAVRAEIAAVVRETPRGHTARATDATAIADVIWAVTVGSASLGVSSPGQMTGAAEEVAVRGVRWVSDGCQTPI